MTRAFPPPRRRDQGREPGQMLDKGGFLLDTVVVGKEEASNLAPLQAASRLTTVIAVGFAYVFRGPGGGRAGAAAAQGARYTEARRPDQD